MKTKTPTILFDANPLVNGNKSGVGYYGYRLLDALATNYPDEIQIKAHYFNFLGRKQNLDLPTHPNIVYVQSRIVPGKVLNLVRKFGFQLPLELFFKSKGDVAIFTNFVSLPSILKIPSLVAVHDLCYEDVPNYVSKKNRLFLQQFVPKSVARAKKVITISESTKRAIIKHYKVPAKDIIITPIPPANDDATKPRKPARVGNKKFILFVSTIEPRKNVLQLVKAYVELPPKLKNTYSLVLAGGIGWDVEGTMSTIKQLQTDGEDIVVTNYVSDEEIKWLYQNADLFVMPSHYEGFGMPILEAMAHDTPTVVSDIPVFHEVSETASLYFNKDDPASIRDAIVRVLEDKKLQNSLVSKGREQVSKYSWQDVATTIYQSIQNL